MRVYQYLRRLLSLKNKDRLSKFLINVGLKPTVNTFIKSSLNSGIIAFSADFEMAWAFRYSKTKHLTANELGLKERENLPVLLKLFNRYQIPVTWATVGHLFLKECNKNDAPMAHPEMKRPTYFENRNWLYNHDDWFQHDPCSNYIDAPGWYAPDLVDQIIKSPIKHEIGCHTFSHIDFTYQNCTPELATSELDKCIELAEEKGIVLKSMVFPGGTAGNYEILRKKGFTCYRKPMKYHIDLPYIDSYSLVAIPSSISLDKDPYGWTIDFHLKLIKKYIEKASEYKLVCHFWFHPSMDEWYLNNVMPGALKIVAEFRSSEKIQVLTMGEIADQMLKQNPSNI